MQNVIYVLVPAVILGSAILYVFRAKKQGQTCIGCPCSKECAGKMCKKMYSDVNPEG